jgi:protein-L-isoaspartate O-methyltransferase
MSLTGLRERLVAEVLQTSGIGDERIAAALRDVPRHLFLPHLPLEEGYLGDGPDTRGSAVRRKTTHCEADPSGLRHLRKSNV